MEMDQIDPIGLQPLQAALDALEQRLGPPVGHARLFGMPALGEQMKFVAPPRHGLADQLLAVHVALGRVDHVQAGVERVAEQPGDDLGRRLLEADLRAAEAEHADLHVGLAVLTCSMMDAS